MSPSVRVPERPPSFEELCPRASSLKPNLLSRLNFVRGIAYRVMGNNGVQEFLGELMTAVVAHALGFRQADLQMDTVHGPDQIVRHTQNESVWGIFEAKGGTLNLARSPAGLSRLNTAFGTQMSAGWITGWIDKIAVANQGKPDGDALREAARNGGPPMLAVVSRLRIATAPGRKGAIQVAYDFGLQKYDPPIGQGMVPWKGF